MSTAVPTEPQATRGPGDAPYIGLRPYTEGESALFFGREKEATELADKILSAPITVLYGLSGVGKSSLLRARVIDAVRALEARVVYIQDWMDDPVPQLRRRVAAELGPKITGSGDSSLFELARALNGATQEGLVLVLDQFEQFFLRHGDRADALGEELGALARLGPDAHVVLSLREEYLGRLDSLRGHLLTIPQAQHRLAPLSGDAAREAIRGPLRAFQASIEDTLVEALLADLREQGEEAGTNPAATSNEGISLPFLQIVCLHLWETTAAATEHRIAMVDYERLGGRDGVVQAYVSGVTKKLEGAERLEAARILDRLAPKEGVKMAYPEDVLPGQLGIDVARVGTILNRLEEKRIVHRREGVVEVYHDAFTKVLRGFIQEQLDAAKKAEEKKRQDAEAENKKLDDERKEAEARARLAEQERELERARLQALEAQQDLEREQQRQKDEATARQRRWKRAAWTMLAVLVVLGGMASLYYWNATKEQKELNERNAVVVRAMKQAEQFALGAGVAMADERWDEAALALVPGLESLRDARALGQEPQGPRDGDSKSPTDEIPVLSLLSHRFTATNGAVRLLPQDREGFKAYAVDRAGRSGAVLLADGRTIQLFDADHPGSALALNVLPAERKRKVPPFPAEGNIETIDWFGGSIRDLVMSSDGSRLLVLGQSDEVVVVDVRSQKRLSVFRTSIRDPKASISRNGRLILLKSSTFDAPAQGEILALRLADDGRPMDRPASLKPPASGARVAGKLREAHYGDSPRWAFLEPSPDGEHVVGLWNEPSSARCQWRGWALAGGEPIDGQPFDACAGSVVQSSGGELLAVEPVAEGGVQVWKRKGAALEKLATVKPGAKSVERMLLDDTGVLLLLADKTVEGWDLPASGDPTQAFSISPGERMLDAMLAPADGRRRRELLVRTKDDIVLFDLDTKEPRTSVPLPVSRPRSDLRAPTQGARMVRMDAARREATVVTGDSVLLLDLAGAGAEPQDQMVWGGVAEDPAKRSVQLAGVRYVQWGEIREDRLILLTALGDVWLADLRASVPVPQLWASQGPPIAEIVWAPSRGTAGRVVAVDGARRLISGTLEGPRDRISIGEVAKRQEGSSHLSLSDDGRWAAVRMGAGVAIWDLKMGRQARLWDLPKKTEVAALAVAWTPRGPFAIAGDEKGGVHVLETQGEKGIELSQVPGEPQHTGSVSSIVLDNDGRFATGAEDGTIALWSIEEKPRRRVSVTRAAGEHAKEVWAMRLTADGKHLLSGDAGGQTRVWDARTGQLVCKMSEHRNMVMDIQVDPANSRRALSWSWGGRALLWDVDTCKVSRTFDDVVFGGFVSGAVVTVAGAGIVTWWPDAAEKREGPRLLPAGALQWVGVLKGRVVAGDEQGGVFTWPDPPALEPEKPQTISLERKGGARGVELVVTAADRMVALTKDGFWFAWGEKWAGPLEGKIPVSTDGTLRAAALSADGQRLLVVEAPQPPSDEKEKVAPRLGAHVLKWVSPEWTPGTPVYLAPGAVCGAEARWPDDVERVVTAGVVHGDLRVVAIDPDGCVRIWADSGDLLLEAPSGLGAGAALAALSPSGDRLIVAARNNAVSIFAIKPGGGAEKATLRRIGWEPSRHQGSIRTIAFHPKGRFAVTAGDDTQAWLWDAQSGRPLVRLGTHPGPILWAAFSSTGDRVFTGGAEAWLRAWDTRATIDEEELPKLLETLYRWAPQLRPEAPSQPTAAPSSSGLFR